STDAASTSNVSEVQVKKFPRLRGGGYCHSACCAIVVITILIVIGLIILSAAGYFYNNDNNNTNARNAVIAGGVILAVDILGCFGAICQACQDSCDFCCKCHLTC
ncbi:unnamed protein product, partial [Adineta steineri]